MTSPTGDFKIAEGYVEVVTRVDRSDIKAAGREAAAEFEAALTPEFTAAGTRSGRSFSTQVSRTGETALRDSRSTFARVGEEIGQSVGTSVGTKFGDTLSQAGSTVSAKLSSIGSDISSKFGKVLGTLVSLVKPAAEFGAALEYI
ncbi:MAG TPA: hypothetical protein VHA75_20655, partial [Rugosimonospora sp.]|nr:hypothetical protein [Rugosimonospora sp.]